MTSETKAHLAEYSVSSFRAFPLLVALERCAAPDVTIEKSWEVMKPGEDEPIRETASEDLAEDFRAVGAITVEHEHETKTVKQTKEISLKPWKDDIEALADELDLGYDEGHVKMWGSNVKVETPAELGIGEHTRRRTLVQNVLDEWNQKFQPLYAGGWEPRVEEDWRGEEKTYHGEFSLKGIFTKVKWSTYSDKFRYTDRTQPNFQGASYDVECSTRHSKNVCERVVSDVKADRDTIEEVVEVEA